MSLRGYFIPINPNNRVEIETYGSKRFSASEGQINEQTSQSVQNTIHGNLGEILLRGSI
jgi:hypothetical protein